MAEERNLIQAAAQQQAEFAQRQAQLEQQHQLDQQCQQQDNPTSKRD